MTREGPAAPPAPEASTGIQEDRADASPGENAPGKRLVLVGEGTHTLMLEKNRMELLDAVQAFLEEDAR